MRIQVAEIRESATTSGSENHSLKLQLIFLLNGSSHVANRNHSGDDDSLSNQGNTFLFKLILVDRLRGALTRLDSFGINLLQLDLLMFLFFDFTLSPHNLGLLCSLDDLSGNSHDTLVFDQNVEVVAHILQHFDLLLKELLLLLDFCLDVFKEYILGFPTLLKNSKQGIVEVVDGANFVNLNSHLCAFCSDQTNVSINMSDFVTQYGAKSRRSGGSG